MTNTQVYAVVINNDQVGAVRLTTISPIKIRDYRKLSNKMLVVAYDNIGAYVLAHLYLSKSK